jgi:alkylation response protein AidB-like acyl-CoA dehydrogenase
MIDFSLSEDQELIQETARSFAAVLRERLRDAEERGAVPPDVLLTYAELGLAGLDLPETVGGAALGIATTCVAAEELAAGDLGTAYALPGFEGAARLVRRLGGEVQHQRFLAPYLVHADWCGAVAWHDGDVPVTAAREADGWVLRGDKIAVERAPVAGYFFVRADAGEARSVFFAVGADAPGIRVDEARWKLGLNAVPTADMHFDDVVVDEAAVLCAGDVDAGLSRAWLETAAVNAAFHVGVARASHQYALKYAEERIAFGKPVAHFQAIAFMLADAAMNIDAARWSVWRAAWALDHDQGAAEAVAQGLVNAWEVATQIVDDGVQLLGGAGYVFDHPVEKWMRDQKTLSLCGVTPEAAEDLLAACALGEEWSPGDLVPDSDCQIGLL